VTVVVGGWDCRDVVVWLVVVAVVVVVEAWVEG
jgi:hypothetical protein